MLSNTIKQKRKEKAGKWEVPLPKVILFSSRSYLIEELSVWARSLFYFLGGSMFRISPSCLVQMLKRGSDPIFLF